MPHPKMPKAYEPKLYESAVYDAWEKSGLFKPDHLTGERKESFSIVLPPPNVTGTLHLGHAAMLAIEDLMVRYARLSGKKTVWVPGTDHAAIATQSKVEKELVKKGMKDPRRELGREALLKEVEKFAADSHDTIVGQIRKMGASIDWSREAYTLDETRNRAVNLVFKKMYEDGLIYRGFRVVNWDPLGQTVISDDEIVYKEIKAKLLTFTYDKQFPIAISTTRPETKVGDTAVAVHPDDARYLAFVGKTLDAEFCGVKLSVKVVADASVDMAFGTGALGVTPAHSVVDADIAERHSLPMKQMIGEDGRMMMGAGLLAGKTTWEAREIASEWLRAQGLMQKEEDVAQNLSTAERSGGVIEPLPKLQWFIGVNRPFTFEASKHAPIKGLKDGQEITLKQLMQHVVREGEVKILPERFDKTYFHWINNLRDWNISRQIWYGHRVPVWYCKACGSEHGNQDVCNKPMVSVHSMKLCPACKGPVEQDPDTLDTWFSSGLWTFSTLLDPAKAKDDVRAWANASADFKTFHPTSVLETGYDILFFWVARMILMTTCAIGEVPFKTVYLHGLVRDEQGRKMSKSLGNIIDPVDMIEKFGADATRLALILGSTPGNDMKLSEEKIAGFRNFTNKLWNISRFVLSSAETSRIAEKAIAKTLADKWILSRFARTQELVTKHLEHFAYSAAGETLRDFTWGDFADWYLEIAKIQGADETLKESTDKNLLFILSRLLILWHPFMPFVTEEIWSSFAPSDGVSAHKKQVLMVASWPKAEEMSDEKAEREFAKLQEIIVDIRNVRATHKVPPAAQLGVEVLNKELFQIHGAVIRILARVRDVDASVDKTSVATSYVVLYLPSVDTEKERARLSKEWEETKAYVASIEAKLANKDFVAKAPMKVTDTMRAKKTEAEAKAAELEKQLKALG